jgi:phage N-6-adenine-methyltransferase
LPWLAANEDTLGFKERTAQLLIRGAERANTKLTADLSETEILQINRMIWGNNGSPRTLATGEYEWYTPPKYIELARLVLGEIDLDPASNDKAQETVRAARYFTAADEGLRHEWNGRVWLNPPYAQPLIGQFVTKMVEERAAGRVTAGIMLTHNYTDTTWFHEAAEIAEAACFTRGRIAFLEPTAWRARLQLRAKRSSISAKTERRLRPSSWKSARSGRRFSHEQARAPGTSSALRAAAEIDARLSGMAGDVARCSKPLRRAESLLQWKYSQQWKTVSLNARCGRNNRFGY